MADKIIAQYDIETNAFKAKIKDISTDYKKAEKAGVDSANKVSAAYNKAGGSAKGLGGHISGLKQQFSGLGAGIAQVGAAMGVAFSVQQVIQFGKASAEAFIDAEKNAQLLLFALKGNEAAQNRLMAQASRIQENTIFDDDSVQQAQTFLATQGRTEEQIKKVIDAAVELSTVTGVDLNTAVMQLDGTFEGNIGKLAKLDSAFKKLTPEQLANGAAADLLIEKYGGVAEAMGDTTAGKVAKLKNQFGELQETVGGELVPVLNQYVEVLNKISKQDFQGFMKSAGDMTLMATDKLLGLIGVSQKYVEKLTDQEIAQNKIIASTDEQIAETRKLIEAQGGSTAEFDKYVESVRQSQVVATFERLAQVLDITEKQYQRLTNISDKYNASARISSDLILDIRTATEQDLEVAFQKFNTTLGVTRKDFDDYIGQVKELKPLQEDLGKSTEKMVGPYDQLSKAVSNAFKGLQDMATLFEQGSGGWDVVIAKAQKYADLQNELTEVNRLTTEALKRQTREALLPLGDALDVVMVKEGLLRKEYKFTDEQIKQRDEIFKSTGTNQISTYEQTLEQIAVLREAELKASIGHFDKQTEIIQRYTNAIQVLQLRQTEQTLSAMGELAGSLSTTLSQIFGDAAKKNVEFASFIQALTVTEILFKQGAAIANSIEKITTATDPFQVIAGIAGIIASIGSIFSGISQTVQGATIPEPPSFYEGTGYVKLGNNPKGIDTIPAYLNEGEGIVTTKANAKYAGFVDMMNRGTLDKYILTQWVTPALQEQEKQLKKEFADNLAHSMLLQKGEGFDDYRLFMAMKDVNNTNLKGFTHLIAEVKKQKKKRGGYA